MSGQDLRILAQEQRAQADRTYDGIRQASAPKPPAPVHEAFELTAREVEELRAMVLGMAQRLEEGGLLGPAAPKGQTESAKQPPPVQGALTERLRDVARSVRGLRFIVVELLDRLEV